MSGYWKAILLIFLWLMLVLLIWSCSEYFWELKCLRWSIFHLVLAPRTTWCSRKCGLAFLIVWSLISNFAAYFRTFRRKKFTHRSSIVCIATEYQSIQVSWTRFDLYYTAMAAKGTERQCRPHFLEFLGEESSKLWVITWF